MGHRNGPRDDGRAKNKPSSLHAQVMLLVFAAGSIGACAWHSAKRDDIKVDPVLDPGRWYSDSVGTRHAPYAAPATEASTDSVPARAAPKAIRRPAPATMERPPAFTLALSDNQPAEAQVGLDAFGTAPSYTAAANVPAAAAIDLKPDAIGSQNNAAYSHTSSVIEWLQSLDSRSSNMQLLIAFLMGLVIGMLLAVPILRRRRNHLSGSASVPAPTSVGEAERLPLSPAEPLADDAHSTFAQTSYQPELVDDAATPSGPEPQAEPAESVPLWSMTAQHAMPPEPVVDLAVTPSTATLSPAQAISARSLVLAEDVRRAQTLLEEGELAQALAVIEPHLQYLPRAHEGRASQIDPSMLALAELHSNIRWKMAVGHDSAENFARAAESLETLLAFKPKKTSALLRLAHCLLKQADSEPDELGKKALLQDCADMLKAINAVDPVPDLLRLGMLGDALCRRVLLDLAIDPALLAEAEATLREALAKGAGEDSGAAWCLQQLLGTAVPGIDPALAESRLQESIVILRLGLKSSEGDGRVRWLSALLRAEVEEIHRAPLNAASRRLRLRDLYSRHAPSMQKEQSPEVLAAWVELLCALAATMVGNAALERYREIDGVLERLQQSDQTKQLYATTWLQMMHSRFHISSDASRRDLLRRAVTILEPCMDDATDALRLQAGKLALTQATSAISNDVRDVAYARALDLVRPLTAVPSLALPALCCALQVLLATHEDKERRVYTTCLQVISPDDFEALVLLARSFHRDGRFIEACQYLEMAWSKRDKALPEDCLDLWQDALAHWIRESGEDEACQRNQRHLRQADTRRFKPRAA